MKRIYLLLALLVTCSVYVCSAWAGTTIQGQARADVASNDLVPVYDTSEGAGRSVTAGSVAALSGATTSENVTQHTNKEAFNGVTKFTTREEFTTQTAIDSVTGE